MLTTTAFASWKAVTWAAAVAWAVAGGAAAPAALAPAEPAVLAQSGEGTGAEAAPSAVSEAAADEAGATGETGEALDVDTLAARVQAFYDAVQTYHADFEQTYTNEAMGETQVSSGHVYFKKPGRMRWDYATPEPKHLISNGRTLWVYEPEFQQVYQQDLSTSDLPTAVRFLMGEGNLEEDFRISPAECGERTGVHCLHLVPRASQGQYRSLEFVVSADDYSVLETTIVDPVGNTNRFVFSNASTSDELPDEGFEFTPTPDMRIISPH